MTLHIIYICLPFLFREMWFIDGLIMDAHVGLARLKHNIIVLVYSCLHSHSQLQKCSTQDTFWTSILKTVLCCPTCWKTCSWLSLSVLFHDLTSPHAVLIVTYKVAWRPFMHVDVDLCKQGVLCVIVHVSSY